jgi:hypothetical protein
MTITYKWTIKQLLVKKQDQYLQDIVEAIKWNFEAKEGDAKVSIDGMEILPKPLEGSFINFENLTAEVVIGWLESSMKNQTVIIERHLEMVENPETVTEEKTKLEMHKETLQEMLLEKKQPEKQNLAPPWQE